MPISLKSLGLTQIYVEILIAKEFSQEISRGNEDRKGF